MENIPTKGPQPKKMKSHHQLPPCSMTVPDSQQNNDISTLTTTTPAVVSRENPIISETNGQGGVAADAKGTDRESNQFKFSASPTLEDIRNLQANFAKDRNWDQYHKPQNLFLAMMGEVGEVAELFQWRDQVQEGLPDWSEEEKKHLGQELSDVLLYLVRIAEKCHIDLPSAVIEKMALNAKKYPAKTVYGSSKKYNEYSENT